MPLDFDLFPTKLHREKNYSAHFVGKGHLGYPTTDHLPINRGYTSHVGYLGGAEGYNQTIDQSHDFWFDYFPANASILEQVYYSTNYYTSRSVSLIEAHDPATPLYLDLRYQGVHGPYVNPPAWEQVQNTTANEQICGAKYACQIIQSMVSVVDSGIANVTAALKARGFWDNTLLIFFADNGGGMGGSEPSNNYPLRGTKGEPWEGGIRVAAFVSGGLVPPSLRGTNNSAFISVADWYPTILGLAGLTPAQIKDDVLYNGTVRPLDGIDAWPVLTGAAKDLGREYFPATNQSLIWNSTWKLITTAPSTHWFTRADGHVEDGWPCRAHGTRNASTQGRWECEVCSDAQPCLFDIVADPQERHDLAKQYPAIVAKMQAAMPGRNFPPYTGEPLLPHELPKYDCQTPVAARERWGREAPCCTPKGPGPWPPLPPPPTPPAPHALHSNVDPPKNFSGPPLALEVQGWCFNTSMPGGGVPPLTLRVAVDGHVLTYALVADVDRGPSFMPRTGAPNAKHGFHFELTGQYATLLHSNGTHRITFAAKSTLGDKPGEWTLLDKGVIWFKDGHPAK